MNRKGRWLWGDVFFPGGVYAFGGSGNLSLPFCVRSRCLSLRGLCCCCSWWSDLLQRHDADPLSVAISTVMLAACVTYFLCVWLVSSCTRWSLYPDSILMRRPFILFPGLAPEAKLRSGKLCLASSVDGKGQVVVGYYCVFILATCILPGGLGILYFRIPFSSLAPNVSKSSHECSESCIIIRGQVFESSTHRSPE